MTTEAPETNTKKLTLEDPVDPDTMTQLGGLESRRMQAADRLLELEQEKVHLLSAVHQIEQQRQRIFEKVLLDRGLPPNSNAVIDAENAKIQLIENRK